MPLPTQTFASIMARGTAFFRTSLKLPLGPKSFLGKTTRAASLLVWSLQKTLELLDLDIVPSPQSSITILHAWAFLLGLPNGQGGYGALLPTTASGGAATPTGALGTVFPDGAIATAEDGTTQIMVSGTKSIAGTPPGSGSIAVKLVAVTPGSVGNLAVGTICTWQSPTSGSDATFRITGALTNGNDDETADGIYKRIVARLQRPPNGGNSEDYTEWAQTIAGIVGVFVYPRRSGTGTVDVAVTAGGSGVNRVPSDALVAQVQAFIDSVRPDACDGVFVIPPRTLAGHAARVRVVPNGANGFDWGDDFAGMAYIVDAGGFSPGPPATIRLTNVAAASLTAAIDAYKATLGPKPRLQIISTGGQAVNPFINAIDYVTSGGKTTITLDTAPAGWTAPSDGDKIYPYGDLVASIAPLVLAVCDGLGPSRLSGYGDEFLPWNDTLSLNQIIRVVEDAADAQGTPLVTEVPAGGATIDGIVQDVEAIDDVPSLNPELLFLSSVAITQ